MPLPFLEYNTLMAKTQEANQRMRAASRARILAAAEAVFARRGFHAARISDIAAEADMSVGSLYWYFPTKEAVLAEIVRAALNEQTAVLAAAADLPGLPRERVDALVEGSIALLERRRGGQHLLAALESEPDALGGLEFDLAAARREQDAYLERIFAAGLPAGMAPAEMAALYRAVLRGLALDPAISPSAARAALLRLFGRLPAEDNRGKWKRPG